MINFMHLGKELAMRVYRGTGKLTVYTPHGEVQANSGDLLIPVGGNQQIVLNPTTAMLLLGEMILPVLRARTGLSIAEEMNLATDSLQPPTPAPVTMPIADPALILAKHEEAIQAELDAHPDQIAQREDAGLEPKLTVEEQKLANENLLVKERTGAEPTIVDPRDGQVLTFADAVAKAEATKHTTLTDAEKSQLQIAFDNERARQSDGTITEKMSVIERKLDEAERTKGAPLSVAEHDAIVAQFDTKVPPAQAIPATTSAQGAGATQSEQAQSVQQKPVVVGQAAQSETSKS